MRRACFAAVVLVLASVANAAPPTVDVPAVVQPIGDYATVVPKTDAKAITYIGMSNVEPFPSQFLKDPKAFVLPTRGLPVGRYTFIGVASLNDEHTKFTFDVVIGTPPVPPIPPGPTPTPVPPTPTPVPPTPVPPEPTKTFRVIIIYESMDTYSKEQNSVMFGSVVEKYMNDHCTRASSLSPADWRRFDKDTVSRADTGVINDLWAAVKPKVTSTPCVAVERNGVVEIIPLAANPTEMVRVLDKYYQGK